MKFEGHAGLGLHPGFWVRGQIGQLKNLGTGGKNPTACASVHAKLGGSGSMPPLKMFGYLGLLAKFQLIIVIKYSIV